MTKNKNILIKNIFYMLTFWFEPLNWNVYKKIKVEQFTNVEDLLAIILAKGISYQIKQGLYKEYKIKKDNLKVCRGRIEMNSTINLYCQKKKELTCEFDELTEDILFNQILKATSIYLIKSHKINIETQKLLRKNMIYLDKISDINIADINWQDIHYNKINKHYQMLINICHFSLESILLTTETGNNTAPDILKDFNMNKLYEKFVLNYYKRFYKQYLEVEALEIKWDTFTYDTNLPEMKTDITLIDKKTLKTLIIDTKYYSKMMQEHFDKKTFHSGNMYQIYSYVQNYDYKHEKNVAGMLLYAKTKENVVPDANLIISGNNMYIKTLDLNNEFEDIAKQLNNIANKYFNLNIQYKNLI